MCKYSKLYCDWSIGCGPNISHCDQFKCSTSALARIFSISPKHSARSCMRKLLNYLSQRYSSCPLWNSPLVSVCRMAQSPVFKSWAEGDRPFPLPFEMTKHSARCNRIFYSAFPPSKKPLTYSADS